MSGIVYANKCGTCKSPAMGLICSNIKCKSWRKYRKQAATCKPIEDGITPDNPIIIYCPKCNKVAINAAALRNDRAKAYCPDPNHKYFPYEYIKNRWYVFENTSTRFLYKYSGIPPKYWDYDNGVKIKLKQ